MAMWFYYGWTVVWTIGLLYFASNGDWIIAILCGAWGAAGVMAAENLRDVRKNFTREKDD